MFVDPVWSSCPLPAETLFAPLDQYQFRAMLPEGTFDYYTVVVPQGLYYGKIKAPPKPSFLVKGSEAIKLSEGEEKELEEHRGSISRYAVHGAEKQILRPLPNSQIVYESYSARK